jgi:hypothetical protein
VTGSDGVVTVGTLRLGSRSPCAGLVRKTAAKSPASPASANRKNRRIGLYLLRANGVGGLLVTAG